MSLPFTISDFTAGWPVDLPAGDAPWDITAGLSTWIDSQLPSLGQDYQLQDNVAIHHTVKVEQGAVIKGPAIIGPHCFIAAHAYLRGGVWLGERVTIGPGCEIKASIILARSTAAHFNYIGDSIVCSDVNIEAGAVIANHYNERADKGISVKYRHEIYATGVTKFGAVIGDFVRIGANAVLSPGTLLLPHSVVHRLALVAQVPL
ncbi:MAG: LpxA family transferase [Bacteroidetes bacterium]|nr:LpxA family transferase [Bacteroidota bacterium]